MDETAQLVPSELPADVRWGFTREGLDSVLHHTHFIAANRGASTTHMSTNWPGLSVGEAIAAARAAGAITKSRKHFSGHAVRRGLCEFHILHDGSGRVVRNPKR